MCSAEKTGHSVNTRTHGDVPSLAGMDCNFHHRSLYGEILPIYDQNSIDNPLMICGLMNSTFPASILSASFLPCHKRQSRSGQGVVGETGGTVYLNGPKEFNVTLHKSKLEASVYQGHCC